MSNTSKDTTAALVHQVQQIGFDIQPNHVFTSISAARSLVARRQLCPYLLLQPQAAVEFEGLPLDPPHNAVVVGLAKDGFSYSNMNAVGVCCCQGWGSAWMWVGGCIVEVSCTGFMSLTFFPHCDRVLLRVMVVHNATCTLFSQPYPSSPTQHSQSPPTNMSTPITGTTCLARQPRCTTHRHTQGALFQRSRGGAVAGPGALCAGS